MSGCSFNRLWQLLDDELDLDGQLEVYDHLDRCSICRDAVYELARDRDEAKPTGCTYLIGRCILTHDRPRLMDLGTDDLGPSRLMEYEQY